MGVCVGHSARFLQRNIVTIMAQFIGVKISNVYFVASTLESHTGAVDTFLATAAFTFH